MERAQPAVASGNVPGRARMTRKYAFVRDDVRNAIIEECAKIADPWPGFNVGQKISEPDLSVIEVRMKIAAAIRALAVSSQEHQ